MNRARNAGFTLTELMVTLGVVAILAGLAAPSIGDFIRNSRLSNGVNDLLHSLQVARTEAIKRQLPGGAGVVVCGSANPLVAGATCAYNTFRGWIVFVDGNANWQHDAGEQLIEQHGPIDASVTVAADANHYIVSYNGTGFANPTDPIVLRRPTGTVVICDSRGVVAIGANATARALFIRPTGRARASANHDELVATLPLVGGTCP